MEDKKLAERLKQKDEAALEELIIRYSPLVSGIAFNISAGQLSRSDIEEIASDVFITLWKNSEELKSETLKGYICCITKSRTKDKLRRESRQPPENIDDNDEADDFFIDKNYEKKEMCLCLREEINNLRQPDKEIIIRHYYYYQTVSVIADSLGMNIETVKSKLRRTRDKLRKALQNRGY